MADVRPMRSDDVPALVRLNDEAFREMRARFHLPMRPSNTEDEQRYIARLRRFLETDPGGSWVAEEDGAPVGLSQAIVRDGLWHLSLIAVDPPAQTQGIGRALLDAALALAGDGPGMILASRDPRAARRYARAGFDLHPAMTAWGRVDAAGLPGEDGVRPGALDDLGLVAGVDRAVRGASRAVDVRWMLDHEDAELLVVDDRAWGMRLGNRPYVVAALDDEAATAVLAALLRRVDPAEDTEVGWLTAGHGWAVEVALAARLELHPVGPVFVRGLPAPFPHALACGAFG